MSIMIRKIQEGDFAQVVALIQEFAEFQKHPERMNNSLDRMLAEKAYIHGFVAENEQQQVVGYAMYYFSYHTWSGKSIYLEDLYVQPTHRKQNIGKDLLEAVIGLAKEENCHRVRWQVSTWNTNAQEFYKKMGAVINNEEYDCDLYLR
ncbi:GNAT family N-acetyltransferase [marine bacterium AO1-C]|nr:GNAT family N-acetyltransferase [marine bacterium AO1-C]